MALACESPENNELAITHWTNETLAKEAIKQGIVTTISPRHVSNFLKKNDLQPHRNRYWLNVKPDEKKEERISDICDIYHRIPNTEDEIALSIDEMTGIQALSRIADDLHVSW